MVLNCSYWSFVGCTQRIPSGIHRLSLNYTMEDIVKQICDYYEVDVSKVRNGDSRTENILKAKFLSAFLIRREMRVTSLEMAKYFNTDHSTILSRVKRMEEDLINYVSLRLKVKLIYHTMFGKELFIPPLKVIS